jgi:hypothetical protein
MQTLPWKVFGQSGGSGNMLLAFLFLIFENWSVMGNLSKQTGNVRQGLSTSNLAPQSFSPIRRRGKRAYNFVFANFQTLISDGQPKQTGETGWRGGFDQKPTWKGFKSQPNSG